MSSDHEQALDKWAKAKLEFHRRLLPSEDRPGTMSATLSRNLAKAGVELWEVEDSILYDRCHEGGRCFLDEMVSLATMRAQAILRLCESQKEG